MSAAGIRYHRLGYVVLNVSDPEKSADFYENIVGLQNAGKTHDDAMLFRCSTKHQDIILYKSADPGLKRVAWQMESDESLETARRHLASQGHPILEVPALDLEQLRLSKAFRSIEPVTGAVFEFYTSDFVGNSYEPSHTKIARLGHIVLRSPDQPRTVSWLENDLNFKTSDMVEGASSFMRCFPNPYHHSLGVGTGPAKLHHVNFMVTDLDDIGRAYNRVRENKVEVVYGPGRHPPSESVFLYFLDPDGITVEYSFGMETFPEIEPRLPRTLPFHPSSFDYWNGKASPNIGRIGAIERMSDVENAR